MRRDVYQAIADPTRREILNMISHKTLSINSVSRNFAISRTAVYKHLKILTECGLMVIRQNGRERYCEPRLDKLSEVSDWVKQYRKFWATRFDGLDKYLEELRTKKAAKGKKTAGIYKKKQRHKN
ncbi:MAG: ArsR family transcriptional regulator [Bacteroidota bacterium]